VTFHHGNTRLRLIVDASGQIIQRSVIRRHLLPPRSAARHDRDL
jgi:hypothetical protein